MGNAGGVGAAKGRARATDEAGDTSAAEGRTPAPGEAAGTGAQEGRSPTMADIAAYLGMSRQTVSLVLGEAPGPSAETRERVKAAAERLGYRPHLGAQALRRARSTDIGVVFTPSHATEPEVLDGVYPAAAAHGCGVIVSPQTATRSTADAVAELLGHRCSAIVVIGSDLRRAALDDLARRIPVPLAHVGYGRRNALYDVVRSAGDTGIEAVVDHLVGLGHRHIAYVHTPSLTPTHVRRTGYRRAMRRHGLGEEIVAEQGAAAEEAGAVAARGILDGGRLPTAIVAANDQAALGVVETLLRHGVRIPEDVSVTGFDDAPLARFSFLDLTTVNQDAGRLGTAAVEAVVRRREDPGREPVETVVPTTLVVRGSTAPPGPTAGRP